MSAKNNIIGDPSKDFFESNPQFKYIPYVQDLLDSEGSEKASKVMWAIWYSEDPESVYRSYTNVTERRDMIVKNYVKIEGFNWDKYEKIIETFPKFAMTKAKSRFKKLDDNFDQLLTDLETEENTRTKADIMAKMSTIYKGLNFAEDMMSKEAEKKDQARGDEQPGLFNS